MNNATNDTTELFPSRELSTKQIPEILIFLISFFGNLMVIITVILERRLRSSLNYLVLSLSICNIFVVLLSIPFSLILYTNNGDFTFGVAGCHLLFPLATWAINVSVMSLVTITIDRYIAIVHPMTWRSTQKHTLKIIIANYLYGFVSIIPYAINVTLETYDDGFRECRETWGTTSKKAYTVILFLLQYGIPLPVMVVLYTSAWIHLKRQNDQTIRLSEECRTARSASLTAADFKMRRLQRPSVLSNTSTYSFEIKNMFFSFCFAPCQNHQYRRRASTLLEDPDHFVANGRRRQTIRTFLMFLLIIVIFAISSLPNQVTWLLIAFYPDTYDTLPDIYKTIFYVLHYANCLANPFIYGGLNKYFWRGYKRIFFCFQKEDGLMTSITGTTLESPRASRDIPDLFKEGIITCNPVVVIHAGSLDSIYEEEEEEEEECGDQGMESDQYTEPNMSKKRVKFKLSVSSISRKISLGLNPAPEKRHRKISAALVKDRQRKLTLPILAASNMSKDVKQRVRKHSVPASLNSKAIVFDDTFSILPPAKKQSTSLREKLNILTKSPSKSNILTKTPPKRKVGTMLYSPIVEHEQEFFLQTGSNQNILDSTNTTNSDRGDIDDYDEASNSTAESSILSEHLALDKGIEVRVSDIEENADILNGSDNEELDKMLQEIENIRDTWYLDSSSDVHNQFCDLLSKLERHPLGQRHLKKKNNNCNLNILPNRAYSDPFPRKIYDDVRSRSVSCGQERIKNETFDFESLEDMQESYI